MVLLETDIIQPCMHAHLVFKTDIYLQPDFQETYNHTASISNNSDKTMKSVYNSSQMNSHRSPYGNRAKFPSNER